MPKNNGAPEIHYSYGVVRDAIDKAIIYKETADIHRIIADNPNALAQLKHSKTPFFAAIERVLGNTNDKDEEVREHTFNMVAETLQNIFEVIGKKFGDEELRNALIHSTCNHISHSALVPSGATLRDMMEEYAGINLEQARTDKKYSSYVKLVDEFGLLEKDEVARERLPRNKKSNKELNREGR